MSREDIDSDSEAEEKTPQENKRNESEVGLATIDLTHQEPPSPASSALSSVYDEPPSKRRQSGSKNSKANGKKAAKDPNEGVNTYLNGLILSSHLMRHVLRISSA